MTATTVLSKRQVRAKQKAKERRMSRSQRWGRGDREEIDLTVHRKIQISKFRTFINWWKKVTAKMKAMIKL
jgi:hypothetical protein